MERDANPTLHPFPAREQAGNIALCLSRFLGTFSLSKFMPGPPTPHGFTPAILNCVLFPRQALLFPTPLTERILLSLSTASFLLF